MARRRRIESDSVFWWWMAILALVIVLGCTPAHGQTFVGADVGRLYDLRDGRWVHAVTPVVSTGRGPFTVEVSGALRGGWLWQDVTVYHEIERGRLSFRTQGSATRFPGLGTDLSWSSGFRWKIR